MGWFLLLIPSTREGSVSSGLPEEGYSEFSFNRVITLLDARDLVEAGIIELTAATRGHLLCHSSFTKLVQELEGDESLTRGEDDTGSATQQESAAGAVSPCL